MDTHPAKLVVIHPMYEAREYRRHLVAIDDSLVVHHSADGRFQLELRPMVKLTTRGAKSYGAALQQIARDVETGHRVIIVGRDRFLADLEQLALDHATDKDRDALERAVQLITERTRHQVWDSLFDAPWEYQIGRTLLAGRQRRTRPDKNELSGLNCMFGIPTPRTEQLWHSLRHQWCSPRIQSAGRAAWENWCRANRPAIPKVAA